MGLEIDQSSFRSLIAGKSDTLGPRRTREPDLSILDRVRDRRVDLYPHHKSTHCHANGFYDVLGVVTASLGEVLESTSI